MLVREWAIIFGTGPREAFLTFELGLKGWVRPPAGMGVEPAFLAEPAARRDTEAGNTRLIWRNSSWS